MPPGLDRVKGPLLFITPTTGLPIAVESNVTQCDFCSICKQIALNTTQLFLNSINVAATSPTDGKLVVITDKAVLME